MSAQNGGRQSPSPERSTGAQQQDTPSDGQGVNEGTNNKEESKSQLEVYLFLLYLSIGKAKFWSSESVIQPEGTS
jgi:hypothetical protein